MMGGKFQKAIEQQERLESTLQDIINTSPNAKVAELAMNEQKARELAVKEREMQGSLDKSVRAEYGRNRSHDELQHLIARGFLAQEELDSDEVELVAKNTGNPTVTAFLTTDLAELYRSEPEKQPVISKYAEQIIHSYIALQIAHDREHPLKEMQTPKQLADLLNSIVLKKTASGKKVKALFGLDGNDMFVKLVEKHYGMDTLLETFEQTIEVYNDEKASLKTLTHTIDKTLRAVVEFTKLTNYFKEFDIDYQGVYPDNLLVDIAERVSDRLRYVSNHDMIVQGITRSIGSLFATMSAFYGERWTREIAKAHEYDSFVQENLVPEEEEHYGRVEARISAAAKAIAVDKLVREQDPSIDSTRKLMGKSKRAVQRAWNVYSSFCEEYGAVLDQEESHIPKMLAVVNSELDKKTAALVAKYQALPAEKQERILEHFRDLDGEDGRYHQGNIVWVTD